jgi:hypothetical protein
MSVDFLLEIDSVMTRPCRRVVTSAGARFAVGRRRARFAHLARARQGARAAVVIGTFHNDVRKKYLSLFVAEFQFRYNSRENTHTFGTAISGC